MESFVQGAQSWSARFDQTVLDDRGRVIDSAQGDVQILRPGRFRWQYDKPYRQLIVGDGQTVWIYDEDLEQITRRPQRESLGRTPAALLGDALDLDRDFTIAGAEGGDRLHWVLLTPREDEAQYTAIRLGFEGDALAAMVLSDALGQKTVLHFTGMHRNEALSPTLFEFKPPAGVDVIDAGAAPE
ncbi:MAG: outer membrane lipoprotein chaperone LolA [Gammaproteobacteria bacterium]